MSINTLEKKFDLMADSMKGLTTKVDLIATKVVDIETSIENLAISTKIGFDQVDERFEQVDRRFDQIDDRLDHMDDRFDRIENVSIGNQGRRIENLEDDMRVVKTKIGLKKSRN